MTSLAPALRVPSPALPTSACRKDVSPPFPNSSVACTDSQRRGRPPQIQSQKTQTQQPIPERSKIASTRQPLGATTPTSNVCPRFSSLSSITVPGRCAPTSSALSLVGARGSHWVRNPMNAETGGASCPPNFQTLL